MPEPQNSKQNSKNSSFDAFNSVDKLVSKPILGSDGAASWQEFRKDNRNLFDKKPSTAPLAPLKKADKLGSGLTSWEQERAREEEVRRETGEAALGEGYTIFKAKDGQEEALKKKERKRIEQRIRPDSAEYYISAKTFDGWKWDYVFTTKDRGTGYYWDGRDSLKRLKGELPPTAGPNNKEKPESGKKQDRQAESEEGEASEGQKKKKKRKKTAPIMVNDPSNPIEQVQEAIRKRNERLGFGNTEQLPAGWESAADSSNGNRVYYFNRQTGQRTWEKPIAEALPEGWCEAIDQSTQKKYFYHTSGETRWERPT